MRRESDLRDPRNGPLNRLVDAEQLQKRLQKETSAEVRFDGATRGMYSVAGGNYRQVPIGVVIPKTIDDVIATVAICRELGAPLLSRGGGTSLAGQCVNFALVMDFSKHLHAIEEIDAQKRSARVQPGLVLDELRKRTEPLGLTFGPDPSTHNHCTFGGMIGNNSCGTHSMMAGRTSDNVEALDVLLYDGTRLTVENNLGEQALRQKLLLQTREGEIYRGLVALRDRYGDLVRARYPKIPRRVSGYNLDELLPESGFNAARALVGTEGTCATILSATVRLVPWPKKRSLVVLAYPSVYEAADHVEEIIAFSPMALEGLDDVLVGDLNEKHLHVDYLSLLPDGKGWLLVEFGGDDQAEADAKARALMTALHARPNAPKMKLFDDKEEEEHVWKLRESGLGATARLKGKPDTWEGWEDSAVHPKQLGSYLRSLRKLFEKYHYGCALYGHFGQGCVHTRIDFDLKSAAGIRKYRDFMEEASDLVLEHGGSLSGEHGDGQSRAELLPKMFGNELIQAFREFKSLWDPDWKMNPGKIVNPYKIDDNLRFGSGYRPQQLKTYFSFSEDKHDFAYASERCVGVGDCRRHDGKTMCPSYRVTYEEKHSTRGRARLLNELVRGDVVQNGWQDEGVKEALDLCLACKGCKGDCPVNVDMATYKAEFLAHYYEHHRRPITAYTMGLIYWWARLGSLMPRLSNFMSHARGLSSAFKALGGIHENREVPRFAAETFKQWWKNRPIANEGRPRVLLWVDTFNNHFHPPTAKAAVEVLEAAGYQVIVPAQSLCCGRPLYDYGFLPKAKSLLLQILDALKDDIERGTPLVGLEPSCVSVFKDELCNLLPGNQDAVRLKQQSHLLSEFLDKVKWTPPSLAEKKALVHAHCHHKAIVKVKSEKAQLDKLGIDYELLDDGCCGMAGAFGFEREHYDTAQAVGELSLLPAVRKAAPTTMIVTDGFSCREQIRQSGGRQPLHFAELMAMALHPERATAESIARPIARHEHSASLASTVTLLLIMLMLTVLLLG
jgi:FAD/FMN-containing dehydrogenase/Fe-S oxidoreductase